MRDCLNFPRPDTIKNYFETIDSPVELRECEKNINSVFTKLTRNQTY